MFTWLLGMVMCPNEAHHTIEAVITKKLTFYAPLPLQ